METIADFIDEKTSKSLIDCLLYYVNNARITGNTVILNNVTAILEKKLKSLKTEDNLEIFSYIWQILIVNLIPMKEINKKVKEVHNLIGADKASELNISLNPREDIIAVLKKQIKSAKRTKEYIKVLISELTQAMKNLETEKVAVLAPVIVEIVGLQKVRPEITNDYFKTTMTKLMHNESNFRFQDSIEKSIETSLTRIREDKK